MKTQLIMTIAALASAAAFESHALAAACTNAQEQDIPGVVDTIKDAIKNAKENCPDPADEKDDTANPKSFQYVKTYQNKGPVTRQCKITFKEMALEYKDAT